MSLFLLLSTKSTNTCPVKWFGNIVVTRLDKATYTNEMIRDCILINMLLNRFCHTFANILGIIDCSIQK